MTPLISVLKAKQQRPWCVRQLFKIHNWFMEKAGLVSSSSLRTLLLNNALCPPNHEFPVSSLAVVFVVISQGPSGHVGHYRSESQVTHQGIFAFRCRSIFVVVTPQIFLV